MTTTDVLIQDELGILVPNVPSVPIVAGDSVIFTAGDGADTALYFSPASVSILTPLPSTPVSLAAGSSVTYTFAAPAAGAYGVILNAPDAPPPNQYDFGPLANPPVLAVQPGQPIGFTPVNVIKV